MQLVAVVLVEYFPTGHFVHVVIVMYCPGVQLVQYPVFGLHEVQVDEHA